MVRIIRNLNTQESIKLESGEFRAEFNVDNDKLEAISIHFYGGSDEQSCNLYPIKPTQIDDLTDLISQLRVELRKRGFETSLTVEETPDE